MQLATAVILSLEKQDFLRSQLVYYADRPVHLILADGSDKDWGSGKAGNVGKMSWEYFRISGPATYWLRMQMAVRRVNTKYCFLLDEEDCALWTGVHRAVAFLQSHPSFSSAGGRAAFATRISKRIGLSTAPRFEDYELSHHDGEVRLTQLLRDRRPAHLFYQVHTTQNISALVNEIVKLPPSIELASSVKYIPVFLALTGMWKADSYPFLIRRTSKSNREPHNYQVESFLEADCRQMAVTVYRAAVQLAEQTHQKEPKDVTESITRIIHGRYKTFRIQGETYHTTWRQKVAPRLLFPLFDHFPRIYGLIRRNGLQTTRDYADRLKCGSYDVQKDLHFLEQLWISHPNGVAVNELELLLNH